MEMISSRKICVIFSPTIQRDALGQEEKVSSRWNNAVPAVADVIVTLLTFITVAASTSSTTSVTFQHARLRKENCRTNTLSTVSTHSFNVTSMTTKKILAL